MMVKKGKGEKRKGKEPVNLKSTVWDHFTRDAPNSEYANCNYCTRAIKCPSKNGTSSLHNHLSRCKKYPYNRDKKQKLLVFQNHSSVQDTGDSSSTFVTWSFNQEISRILIRLPREVLEKRNSTKTQSEDVNSVILSVSNDRWIWSLDSSGEFSIKSTRLFIDDHLLLAVGAPTRWVSEVPIKINIMAWKVSLDKLPTRLNLSLRGIEIPSITCPICSCAGSMLTFFLIFVLWPETLLPNGSWWEFDWALYIDLFSYDDWLEWFHTLRLLKGFKDILEGVFYVMWWVI
ncbi:RNA-directed DNA polymerase, eukaryota [Tanacetum coccineum]